MTEVAPQSHELSEYKWPSPAITACPYPFYAALRSEAPVYHVPGTKTYLLSRWDDIAQVAQNAEVYQQPESYPQITPHFSVDFETVERYTPQATVTTNGPDHKIKRAWGLRLVERDRLRSYEPLVTSITDELIDSFIDEGECEFRWAFAEQLPAYVMMDLLGLPREDATLFQRDEIVMGGDFQSSNRYVLEKLKERLEDPGDDFLSELLQDQVERDGCVDINYQVAQGTNLIGAGSETTAHVLVSMMQILCGNPDVMESVRSDRSLLRPLVEETMRLETPVQWLPRITTQDSVVGGVDIPAGSTLWLLWGSGNRDPEKFEEPDEFRLDRPSLSKNQLGFGRGPHLCLGAPLARQEAVIGFDRLLTRLTNIRVVEEKSDLTNVMKEAPTGIEGVFDATGCMHAAKTLVIAFEKA
jgi:cytochrome P450